MTGSFWLEITGIAVAGGLGCSLGELTIFLMSIGAKKISERIESDSKTLEKVKSFGSFIFNYPKRMYFYIFVVIIKILNYYKFK